MTEQQFKSLERKVDQIYTMLRKSNNGLSPAVSGEKWVKISVLKQIYDWDFNMRRQMIRAGILKTRKGPTGSLEYLLSSIPPELPKKAIQ